MKLFAAALLMLVVAIPTAAVEPTRFQRAQRHAWDGQRQEARVLCEEILAESPTHHDARILLARVDAWDGNYDSAREQLQRVLLRKPEYIDAYRALADTEMWSDDDQRALYVIEQGLSIDPRDLELRFRRVQVLEQLDRVTEAYRYSTELQAEAPGDDRLPRITRRLRLKTRRWWASVGYRYESFEQFGDPWQEWSATLKRQQRWGSLFGRLRHARRFGKTGEQFEFDAYPKLPKRRYLYLNIGFGEAPFPDLRAGAEMFKNFAEGWEGSIGARYLDFGSSDVVIYTGSISKYISDYWISIRPVFNEKELGLSTSYAVTVRRYLSGETWVGTTVGFGSKPQAGVGFGEAAPGVIQLTSSRYSLSGQFRINDLWRLKTDLGFREKDSNESSNRSSVSGSISMTRAF